MFAYIIKRALSGIVVLFLISLSVFLLFWYGPSSPAQPICDRQTQNRCTPERLARFEENLGFNNAWYEEYGKFVKGVFVGREIRMSAATSYECGAPCLGVSYRTTNPVWEELKDRLPATVSVAVGGSFLYLLFGVPIGVAAARRRGTVADKALVSSFLALSSIPYYLFALLFYLLMKISWQVPWVSKTGYFSPFKDGPIDWVGGMALAWIALGIFGCTQYTRYARGSMVETLSEDYIRTAKAKGLSARAVVGKHTMRAALTPIVTMAGMDLALVLGGAPITETVFNFNGLGKMAVEATLQYDLPITLGIVVFLAAFVILANIIVDIAYAFIDPRVRLD